MRHDDARPAPNSYSANRPATHESESEALPRRGLYHPLRQKAAQAPTPARPAPAPATRASVSASNNVNTDDGILRRVDGSIIESPTRKRRPARKPESPTTPVGALRSATVMPADDDEPILDLPGNKIPEHLQHKVGRMPPVTPLTTTPTERIRPALVSTPVAPPRPAIVVPTPPDEEVQQLVTDMVPEQDAPCERCGGAGFLRLDVPLGHPQFGKIVPCQCRESQNAQRRRVELWKLSNLDAFNGMRFESFDARVPGAYKAWEIAQQYAQNPDGWLILSGVCGSGKTHLAAAVANAQFEQGAMVLFTVVPNLLDHLRSVFAPNSETTYDILFNKILTAGLLVLDDLGAEYATPWAQEKLFQIINHRYMYRLPTVVTTNLDLLNDLDDRIRSRLNDVSLVRHVRLDAEDYRPRHYTPPTQQPPSRSRFKRP